MKSFDLIKNNLLNKALNFFLFFGFSLFPIYLFDSGSIQISHFLLLIFSLLVLTILGIPRDKYFYFFGIFLIYVIIVNIFYIYYDLYFKGDNNLRFLKELLFLIYNFLLTISLISYYYYQRKFNLILYGLITAIGIMLISLLYKYLIGITSFRFTGFFNNPNQLGYYCVCCFSLIYLFYRNLYISYKLMIFFMLIVIFLSILTLSKAAYISLILCFMLAIKPFNYKYSKIVWILFFLIILFLFILFFQQISDTSYYRRIINIASEEDSSLEVRGYLVYFKASFLQSIFGLGPKNVYLIHGYEIHSTFAMILSSYGLVGFLIFSLLMFFGFWI